MHIRRTLIMVLILIDNHRLSSSSMLEREREREGAVLEISFKLSRSILVLCFFSSDMVELRVPISGAATGLWLRILRSGSE